MWLNQFKIAIIEKDSNKLNKLMDSIPSFDDQKEINEVLYLLKEATELMEDLRDETQGSMEQIKKNINFLNATKRPFSSKLDIRS